MQGGSVLNSRHRAPLLALQVLTDLKLPNNVRPFAQLIVLLVTDTEIGTNFYMAPCPHGSEILKFCLISLQDNFIPEPLTKAVGQEIGRVSFLAPFFNVSILYEDDHKLGDQFFNVQSPAGNSVVNTLVREIDFSRVRSICI